MWALMLPECFSCLMIAQREREQECIGREWWWGEEGERETMCVHEREGGAERE